MSVGIQLSTYELIERLILGRITPENWGDAPLRQALYSAIGAKLAASNADPEQVRRYEQALSVVSENIEASAKAATNYGDFLDLAAAARAETVTPRTGLPTPPVVPEPPFVARPPAAVPPAAVPPAFVPPAAVPPAAADRTVVAVHKPETPTDQAGESEEPVVPGAVETAKADDSTGPASLPAVQPVSLPKHAIQDKLDKLDDRPVRTIPLWILMGGVALLALAYAFWPSGARCSLRSTTCITDRVATSGPGLLEEDARQLRFAIVNVQSTPTHVFARVRIQNAGTRTVHAVSPQPLRFSFRLRPSSQAADSLRMEQFNPNRIEITQDIAPGATIEVPLLAARPAGTAALALELTFVVEARFWAFQIGIEPLAVPVP